MDFDEVMLLLLLVVVVAAGMFEVRFEDGGREVGMTVVMGIGGGGGIGIGVGRWR